MAIPLTILTGFLGAGKTTLLNRILHSDHGLRIAVLVNDFGSINIDSQLVVETDVEDMVNLSNGCICCTIQGDLLAALDKLVRRDDPPDYIVVEASGVADPIDIGLTLRAVSSVRIDSVITVIDAEQIYTLQHDYAVLAMNQVGMADIVIINKIDLVTDGQLQRVRDYVHRIVKDARILETVQCQVPIELLLNVGQYDDQRILTTSTQDVHVHEVGAQDHSHHDHSLIFDTWSWVNKEPVSLKALQRFIKSLPASVYRAKGVFYLADDPEHRAILQVVGRRVNLEMGEPWGETPPSSQFVLISAHGGVDHEVLQEQMTNILACNASKTDIERLGRKILSWLRG